MPAVAGGAGMAAAGGMSIKGSLDTSLIERGFMRVKQGFESVKGQAKSFNADLQRMRETSGGLVTKLGLLGTAGIAAMIGIASRAPAVAGAMAKMSIQFDRFTKFLGTTFSPEFNKAAEYFEKFVNFAETHPDIFKGFVFTAATLAGLGALSKLFGMSVGASVLKMFGFLANPVTLAVLAALATWKGVEAIGKGLGEQFQIGAGVPVPLPEAAKQQIQTATPQELAYLNSMYGDRTTGAGFGPEQTARLDLETGELYSMQHISRDIIRHTTSDPGFQDSIAHLISRNDTKNMAYNSPNRAAR